MSNTDLFDTMVGEAREEVSNHGWKNASQNAVTLASIGAMADKLNRRIDAVVRPAWIIAVSIGCSAIWFVIDKIIGV